MKAKYWLPVLIVATMLLGCNGADRAVAYNDAIVDVQLRVVDQFDRFVDAVTSGDSLGAVRAMNAARDTARTGLVALDGIAEFNDDQGLHDAARSLIQHYATGLDRDFPAILPALVSDYASETQRITADSIRNAFVDEETHLFELLQQSQEKFAKEHGFQVTVVPES